ncbi:MAG: M42 family peptidase, partial [Flavisolibacter sp.]|nr:M42 family peptidase [Flavisolibacter sp.]
MAKAGKKTRTEKKASINDQSFEFFRTYINTPSPVGFEVNGQKLWLQYIRPFVDEIFTDPYGTAVGIVNPGQQYKVVVEAHVDEISWFVNYVTAE